jgi:hypothetical protein
MGENQVRIGKFLERFKEVFDFCRLKREIAGSELPHQHFGGGLSKKEACALLCFPGSLTAAAKDNPGNPKIRVGCNQFEQGAPASYFDIIGVSAET